MSTAVVLIRASDSRFVPAELTGFVGRTKTICSGRVSLAGLQNPTFEWRFIDANGRGERIRTSDL